ncbi:MAG: tetratricopeptide repeat protein [Bacteroidales bacterium]
MRIKYLLLLLLLIPTFSGCSTKKNTSVSRAYNELTARYNVFYNANEGFKKGLSELERNYKDDFSRLIEVHPVYGLSNGETPANVPGFDMTLEKCEKAVQLHSIRAFPTSGKYSSRRAREQAKIEEFNPFMHRVWLLMGEAQFYKTDFLSSVSTFSYITKHFRNLPEVVFQARLWMARCYLAMGWTFDAENTMNLVKGMTVPKPLTQLYHTVMAELLIEKQQYADAIPHLNLAGTGLKSKVQKYRFEFLKGQIYAHLGNLAKANEAYQKVIRKNPPYTVAFNAKIKQTEIFTGGNTEKSLKTLHRMARDPKNNEYLDQVYYAIGNVYLSRKDSANGLKYYALGVEKSERNGIEKAIVALKLADIYYDRRKYNDAQPFYATASSLLPKEHPDYQRVADRTEILSDFVVHFNEVHLQDSLQLLATMPEAERNKAIERVIAEVIRKEKEEAAASLKEEFESKREEYTSENTPENNIVTPPIVGNDKSWYFYNKPLIEQGKAQFKRAWGNRKLEDDWRRRSKSNFIFDQNNTENEELLAQSDSDSKESIESKSDTLSQQDSNNPKEIAFYLPQIPFSAEAKAESDKLIQEGLFQMGSIYKNRLEDYPAALRTFEELLRRFPNYADRLKVWYEEYLMYMRDANQPMAEIFRKQILKEYPDSDMAKVVSDPNYVANFLKGLEEEEKLYQVTYEAYTKGDMKIVHDHFTIASTKFPLSKLMPKFKFLNALSFLAAGETAAFKEAMRELVDQYPNEELAQIAGGMLKGIAEGRDLNATGRVSTGDIWNRPLFGDSTATERPGADSLSFVADPLSPHRLLFIFKSNEEHKNELIYDLARFNFRNFIVREYDIEATTTADADIVTVRSYPSLNELLFYENLMRKDFGFMTHLPPGTRIVAISDQNYEILMKGKSLQEYEQFYEEQVLSKQATP